MTDPDSSSTSVDEMLDSLVRALTFDTAEHVPLEQRVAGLVQDAQAVRLLLESSTEIVSRHSIDGRVLYVSPSVRSTLGYEPDTLVGSDGSLLMDLSDAEALAARPTEDFLGEGQSILRFRARHADGRLMWFESTIRVLTDEDGAPVETVAVSRNVDDRVRAEQEARRQTEQTLRIYERISDAFFAVDREWRMIYMNPVADRMRTREYDEVYGRNMWEVFPDLVDTRFFTEYHRAMRENVPVSLEEYYPRIDRWFEATAYPSSEGLAIFFRDVTERTRSAQTIRESEHRFRAAFDHAATAMAMIDLTGTIQRVNAAMCALLGYDRSDLVSKNVVDLTHRDDVDQTAEAIATLRRGDATTMSYEKRYVCLDGRTIWVQVSNALVRDADGEPAHLISQILDITERKRAEEALRASERMYAQAYERERAAAERLRTLDEMKNTFLSAVSHELRTPLTAIIGFSETLRARDVTLERRERDEMLVRLLRSSRKLERMLGDLLDLDRLSRGIIEPRRKPTDMGELVDRVLRDSEPADGRPFTVAVEPIVADVDGAQVERIIENLVSNAVRHTPPNTPIWLTVARADGALRITVEDAGPGVPENLRSTLFEPFRRGPDAPSHAPGVGIGLSLVERFTSLHGGRAWITDREGGGASFNVSLPCEVFLVQRRVVRSGRLRGASVKTSDDVR